MESHYDRAECLLLLRVGTQSTIDRPVTFGPTTDEIEFETEQNLTPTMTASGLRRGKAALFQWVQAPTGQRSSRKQPEQSWR